MNEPYYKTVKKFYALLEVLIKEITKKEFKLCDTFQTKDLREN
jgi:hypothetical protein